MYLGLGPILIELLGRFSFSYNRIGGNYILKEQIWRYEERQWPAEAGHRCRGPHANTDLDQPIREGC